MSHFTNKSYISDENDNFDDNNELNWQLTWTLAHPTLVSTMLFIKCSHDPLDDYDNNDAFLDQQNIKKSSKTSDSNFSVPLSWSLLAYHEIFGDISGIKTVQEIVAKQRNHNQIDKAFNGNRNKGKFENSDVFNAVTNYEGSNSSSSSITSQANNLGYGEITPRTVMEIVSQIKAMTNVQNKYRNNKLSCSYDTGDTVLDLGSGTGRVLFAAALSHTFHKAIGIEIVEDLHNDALENLRKWNERHPHISDSKKKFDESWNDLYVGENSYENDVEVHHDRNDNINISSNIGIYDPYEKKFIPKKSPKQTKFKYGTKLVFLHEDLNNYSSLRKKSEANTVITDQSLKKNYRTIVDVSSAIASLTPENLNIVIIHATLFDIDLMHTIQSICEDCPSGTYFITVTKCLNNFITSPRKLFHLIEEREREMTWGKGTVYIQRRL